MNKLFNRKANTYIYSCTLILVLSIIMATAMYFAVTSMRIQAIKKEVKNTLDSICTEFSINSYGSVKQDTLYPEPMKKVEIINLCYSRLGFEDEDSIVLSDGTIMHRPVFEIGFENGIVISATFDIEDRLGIYRSNIFVTGGFFRRDEH